MKKSTLIAVYVLVALVVLGLIFLFRATQMKKIDEHLAGFELENGLLKEPVTENGTSYLIPPNLIYDAGFDQESTPAIDASAFVSVDEADTLLADEVFGIVVPAGDVARFYSYQILNWHEVVNETIGDEKLAVTHCTLCRSSVVYNRVVDGQELHFEVSGKVYNNNTLLRDRETGSLWLQATGLAVSGELMGKQLTMKPAPVMTWGSFKEAFPSAEALSVETGFERDYTRHPYTTYDTAETIYFPLTTTDNRLTYKWIVNGVEVNDEFLAFSERIMEGEPVQHDVVGGEPVVAFHDRKTGVTSIFSAKMTNGETLAFTFNEDGETITDASGSTWTVFGLAIDGERAGERLTQLAAPDMFWFCWASLHPDTRVNQIDS